MDAFLDKLLELEKGLFVLINEAHTPFLNVFMFLYTSKYVWIPLILVAVYVFTYKIHWKQSLLIIFCLVLVGTLCDQISVELIKPIFKRLRPSHHPNFAHLVNTVYDYKGGRYGFLSAHAANGVGAVSFAALLVRNRKFTIIFGTWAFLSCYSRVYLGVHFITDILAGALLGSLVGVSVYMLYSFLIKKIYASDSSYLDKKPIGDVKIKQLNNAVILSVLFLLFTSFLITNFFSDCVKEYLYAFSR